MNLHLKFKDNPLRFALLIAYLYFHILGAALEPCWKGACDAAQGRRLFSFSHCPMDVIPERRFAYGVFPRDSSQSMVFSQEPRALRTQPVRSALCSRDLVPSPRPPHLFPQTKQWYSCDPRLKHVLRGKQSS